MTDGTIKNDSVNDDATNNVVNDALKNHDATNDDALNHHTTNDGAIKSVAANDDKGANGTTTNCKFSLVITGLYLLGILWFFIAVFMPIFTYNADSSSLPANAFYMKNNLFYDYFYNIYNAYSKTDGTFGSIMVIILSTLVVLGNLIVCSLSLVFGAKSAAISLKAKQPAKLSKYLILSLLSAIVMIAWFKSFSMLDQAGNSYGQTAGAGLIIGILLAALTLALDVGFDFMKNHYENNFFKRMIEILISLAAILICVTLIAFVSSKTIVNGKVGQNEGSSFGTLLFLHIFSVNIANSSSMPSEYIFAVFSTLFFIVILAIAIKILRRLFTRLISGKPQETFKEFSPLIITACVLIIVYAISTHLSLKMYDNLSIGSRTITAAVIAGLALASQIGFIVYGRLKKISD